jgi:hypothetical protein
MAMRRIEREIHVREQLRAGGRRERQTELRERGRKSDRS